MEEAKQIYSLMSKIMSEIGPISKDQTNTFQKYKFRGIDDIYNACQSILCKHGVIVIPFVQNVERHERPSKDGGALMFTLLTVDYTFYAPDGSSLTSRLVGEAMDSSDKSGNKALSAAQKYLFIQTFCIGTQEPKDSENDTPLPAYKPKASIQPDPTPEDWTRLKQIGKDNAWAEAHMKLWIDNAKKYGKSNADIYQDALAKFGQKNDLREEVKA
jgi:hypothetical protein